MYDFANLSPTDFENLIRDIVEARDGISLETFAPGPDTGIDFRYSGGAGDTIVQAKHYDRSGFSKLKSNCEKEAAKVLKLSPKRYVLGTSVAMTVRRKSSLQTVFAGVPLANADIIGREQIEAFLETKPDVLNRNFKLWLTSASVLERVLKNALIEQSEAEVEAIKTLVPRFVHHGGVDKAYEILDESASLIISGPPGVGKSTLARMIIWLHMEQGWSVRVIHSMDEAFDALKSGEKQLIFFDDFLGQVRVTDDLLRGTDSRLPAFLARVKSKKSARFILTTRDYIYRQAAFQSEQVERLAKDHANLVLDVGAYSRQAKAEILFNHIYFSDLSAEEIEELLENDFYLSIIDHKNFNPRLIEQISKLEIIRDAAPGVREAILRVLDNPDELWRTPYRSHFTDSDQILMIAMAFSGQRASISHLRSLFEKLIPLLEVDIRRHKYAISFETSLKKLEGATLEIYDQDVSFVNPGVRDFMNSVVADDSLIGSVLSSEWSFLQLKRLWEILSCEQDHRAFAGAWVEAFLRAAAAATDADLTDLELAIKVSGFCSTCEQEDQFVAVILERFKNCDADSVSAAGYSAVLDSLKNSDLSQRSIDSVVHALGADLEKCVQHGYVDLTISEAVGFVDNTGNHPLADGTLYEFAQSVGETVLDNLHEELSDLSSIEEVDELETASDNLSGLLGRSYFYRSETFEEKRREIDLLNAVEESEFERRTPPIRGMNFGVSEEDSIRSMFGSLRQR
jgi:DNA polymerase III delta prime subunit